MDPELEAAKEGGWRELAAIDRAYERGELDDEGWHAAVAALVVPAYLRAPTPQGGSGSSHQAGWGFAVAGRAERPHPHPRLTYRAFWIEGR